MTIVKEKKYFPPPKNIRDFTSLLKFATDSGAGKTINEVGFVNGPWTPNELAAAISSIPQNNKNLDTRTIQLWLQDNDRTPTPANIGWLARIFGCDDPDLIHQWQLSLTSSPT